MASRVYPGGVPRSIEYPDIPAYAFLENSARKFPDRTAATYLGAETSYAELWRMSRAAAAGLRREGVGRGDRVGVLLPNCPQWIIASSATQLLGGIVVALNPLMPREEIGREAEETGCKTLIILDRLLDKLPEEAPRVLVAEAASFAPLRLRLLSRLRSVPGLPEGSRRFEDLLREAPLPEPAKVNPREDAAVILFTSGTAGPPRGVVLTHRNLVANALQSYHWLRGWGYSEKPQPAGWPVVLCAIPFFHSLGLTVLNEAVSFGCTLVLLPQPTPEAIMAAVQRHRATHAPLIPRFINGVLDHPRLSRFDLTSLTHASTGGAPITVEAMRRFEEATRARVYQGYGLTEAGPSVSATPVDGDPKPGTVGIPFPDTEVRIVDTQLGEVEMPPGREGEITIRGPQVMKGYWNDPEATARAIRGGWLFTGDVGKLDEDGYLTFLGRKRDRIVSAGRTVWPSRVEEAIAGDPAVEAVVALGAPDPFRCNTNVQALVVLKKGADPEGAELRLMRLCRSRLEEHEQPQGVTLMPSLPMTPMGKVDRDAVEAEVERRIQQHAEEQGRQSI